MSKTKFEEMFSGIDNAFSNAKFDDLDQVLNKTRKVAETVSRKSIERLELSKKKIEALDVKSKLCKAYEDFGRIQFSVVEGADADESEIENAVEKIKTLKFKLQSINDEINSSKANSEVVEIVSDDEIEIIESDSE